MPIRHITYQEETTINAINSLATGNNLVPGAFYFATDINRVYVAISTSTIRPFGYANNLGFGDIWDYTNTFSPASNRFHITGGGNVRIHAQAKSLASWGGTDLFFELLEERDFFLKVTKVDSRNHRVYHVKNWAKHATDNYWEASNAAVVVDNIGSFASGEEYAISFMIDAGEGNGGGGGGDQDFIPTFNLATESEEMTSMWPGGANFTPFYLNNSSSNITITVDNDAPNVWEIGRISTWRQKGSGSISFSFTQNQTLDGPDTVNDGDTLYIMYRGNNIWLSWLVPKDPPSGGGGGGITAINNIGSTGSNQTIDFSTHRLVKLIATSDLTLTLTSGGSTFLEGTIVITPNGHNITIGGDDLYPGGTTPQFSASGKDTLHYQWDGDNFLFVGKTEDQQ